MGPFEALFWLMVKLFFIIAVPGVPILVIYWIVRGVNSRTRSAIQAPAAARANREGYLSGLNMALTIAERGTDTREVADGIRAEMRK